MICSEVFPTTRLAIQWLMKNYPTIDVKRVSYRMMPGVGTRVIIKELEEVEK
jgi:hypothetical protein